jgi:hypothetical protein
VAHCFGDFLLAKTEREGQNPTEADLPRRASGASFPAILSLSISPSPSHKGVKRVLQDRVMSKIKYQQRCRFRDLQTLVKENLTRRWRVAVPFLIFDFVFQFIL